MKLCMFRTVPLSSVRIFSLYTQQWYMLYRFDDSLRAGSGWNYFLKFIIGMKLYMFGQFLCPSSGVFQCTYSNGICHTGLLTACEQDQDRNVFLNLFLE